MITRLFPSPSPLESCVLNDVGCLCLRTLGPALTRAKPVPVRGRCREGGFASEMKMAPPVEARPRGKDLLQSPSGRAAYLTSAESFEKRYWREMKKGAETPSNGQELMTAR